MARNRPRPRRAGDRRTGDPQQQEPSGQGPLQEQEPARLTVPLAGRQDVEVRLCRASEESPAAVQVRLGRAQLVFTERAAIGSVAARWAEMVGLAGRLPAEFERSTPVAATAGSRLGTGDPVAVRVGEQVLVTGRVVRPRGHTNWLQLQVGPVQFSVRDTTAFHTVAAGLRGAAKLATIKLVESGPAMSAAAMATGGRSLVVSPREVAARSAASALTTPSATGSASGAAGRPGRSPSATTGRAVPPDRSRPLRGPAPGAAAAGGCGR